MDNVSLNSGELKKYLRKIDRIFNIRSLLGEDISSQFVVDYYKQSDYGYRVFHSMEGSVHMALNFDGQFDATGYYGQAKLVREYIAQTGAKRVLELGSGKGFNSIYLAKAISESRFTGIDLTPDHVAIAEKKRQEVRVNNAHFLVGNFQNLPFDSEEFDLIFEVESICHADDMSQALSEAYRVLRPGGLFVLFDGFRKPGYERLGKEVQTASRLAEVTMAVGRSWVIDQWVQLANNAEFQVERVEDFSEAIMPNLLRFQKLARGYFKFPALSNVLLQVLPPHLVKNSIAGLLMPFTVRAGAQGYYMIVLTRK